MVSVTFHANRFSSGLEMKDVSRRVANGQGNGVLATKCLVVAGSERKSFVFIRELFIQESKIGFFAFEF